MVLSRPFPVALITVASLLLVPVVRGQQTYDGVWRGSTSQGHAIELYVTNSHVTRFVFGGQIVGAACTTSFDLPVSYSGSKPQVSSIGELAIDSPASAPGAIGFTGTATFAVSGSASGNLTFTLNPVPGEASCTGSGSAMWSATRTDARRRAVRRPPPCSFTVSPTAHSFGSTGGAGSVSITTAAGCYWTASSDRDWITIAGPKSGTGNGSVGYNVASNGTSSARTGTLTVAGQTVTVTQSGGSSLSMTGTWVGTFSTNLSPTSSLTLVISQTGRNITGTFFSDNGSDGTISGTVSDSTIAFTLTEKTFGCPGSFNGTATVSGNVMTFTFTGNDCLGYHANGHGSVTRSGSGSAQFLVMTTLAGRAGNYGTADGTGTAARFNDPWGIATDSAGNVYVADTENQTIRKVTPGGVVTTLAGLAGTRGSADGIGSAARFSSPTGVATDSAGNVYVADRNNYRIRKVTPGGVVTTFAGGSYGSNDGTGSAASFRFPSGVATDAAGNVYVADSSNHTIRKVTSGGVVTTLAGLARSTGSDDGTGSQARFWYPWGVATDAAGNVYVADRNNDTIRKVTPEGVVTTLAGLAGSGGSVDGVGSAARFDSPRGVATDSMGNVYVADRGNQTIRKVTPGGVVTTLAGFAGSIGGGDGTGSAARFFGPAGVATNSAGAVYVADSRNNAIRKVAPGGVVTTLAGLAGFYGSTDGTGSTARFNNPRGVATDAAGNIYVADWNNSTIRKVTPAGVVTTVAGLAGSRGSDDGGRSVARFSTPSGVAIDSAGIVYVADFGNDTIRKVSPGGVVTTLAGLAGSSGSTDGIGSAARFDGPSGVAIDSAGNVYVADSGNNTIRKVTPGGVVTTLAGLAGEYGDEDGPGSEARFVFPWGVATDSARNVYVADDSAIRKVTPGGYVTTLAGSGFSYGSADGIGSAARFNGPSGVAIDGAGNLYVADEYNHTIRKVTAAGVVTTLAGLGCLDVSPYNCYPGSADGSGSSARFYFPSSVAIDSAGNVYVSDTVNNTIRKGVAGGD